MLNKSTDLFENCISSFPPWPILAFDSLSLTHSHKLYCALCIVKNTILECTARRSLKKYIFKIADREKQISQCALHVVLIRAWGWCMSTKLLESVLFFCKIRTNKKNNNSCNFAWNVSNNDLFPNVFSLNDSDWHYLSFCILWNSLSWIWIISAERLPIHYWSQVLDWTERATLIRWKLICPSLVG